MTDFLAPPYLCAQAIIPGSGPSPLFVLVWGERVPDHLHDAVAEFFGLPRNTHDALYKTVGQAVLVLN